MFSLHFGLFFVCFCHFVPVLFAFVVLDSVSSVLSQEILARKNVSEITRFVSSGTQNINSLNQRIDHSIKRLGNCEACCQVVNGVILGVSGPGWTALTIFPRHTCHVNQSAAGEETDVVTAPHFALSGVEVRKPS